MPTVLSIYNRYSLRGGEDEVFESELDLLSEFGWRVIPHSVVYSQPASWLEKVTFAANSVWSPSSYVTVRDLCVRHKPDIVHVHNYFPRLSPSVYYAANALGIPVVQTLHNYRLICPNALLYRSGSICHDCSGRRVQIPAIRHACYHDSRLESGVIAAGAALHQLFGTHPTAVARYVALSRSARELFVKAGLAADKIDVKPNFVHPDPLVGDGNGGFFLFVGRLAEHKGVRTLLRAARLVSNVPIKIVGTGPLASEVEAAQRSCEHLEYRGAASRSEVLALMGQATAVIVPSEWLEPFGLVVIESFAKGTPVIASDIPVMRELVDDGVTGLLFRSGDAGALAGAIEFLASNNQAPMRRAARREFEAKYVAKRNFELLAGVYRRAMNAPALQGVA